MRWTVIIPVKPAAIGKSRLAPGGAALARAIALDTVAAVVACPAVDRVLVVSADDDFRPPGAELVPEPVPGGIDDAVRLGAAVAGDRPRAALLGDLPALRPADLAAALQLAAEHPRAYVADREGTGTTLVTANVAVPLVTAFGPGSAARHRELGIVELTLPATSTVPDDVDTVEQLAAARALGLGPNTAALPDATVLPGDSAVRG